jgi:hypothetical protein
MRREEVPQRGQEADAAVVASKATARVGVSTRSSRRIPEAERLSRRSISVHNRKKERGKITSSLFYGGSCTRIAGEPLLGFSRELDADLQFLLNLGTLVNR